jgi:hypothetical protein
MEVYVEFKMIKKLSMIFIALILVLPMVFAGVGLKWDQQSALIAEGKKSCLSYSVYNPWPTETNVKIDISDNLKPVLTMQETETKLVPAYTSSNESIPIEFCFKAPNVYSQDCLIAGLMCEQKCTEEMKQYDGEVIVSSVPFSAPSGGSGGSATKMAVGAPLSIKIQCIPHGRDFTIVYVFIAIMSILIIGGLLYKKYRKSPLERDREQMKRLKDRIKKESKGAKKGSKGGKR